MPMTVEELDERLAAVGALDFDYTETLDIVEHRVIYERVRKNFHDATDAEGYPWRPRKDKNPWPLLIKTGHMSTAAIHGVKRVSKYHLQHGVLIDCPYARTHEFGRGRIPARPYNNVNEADVDQMAEIVADGVEQYLEEHL